MWRFNGEGDLKSYALKHDNYIKNIMLRRGLISSEDTIAQQGHVNIIGRARSRLRLNKENLFANDSLDIDEIFFNLSKQAF